MKNVCPALAFGEGRHLLTHSNDPTTATRYNIFTPQKPRKFPWLLWLGENKLISIWKRLLYSDLKIA